MRKNNSFVEYTAPELEVVSTIVEQGFTMSANIELASEEEYGSF